METTQERHARLRYRDGKREFGTTGSRLTDHRHRRSASSHELSFDAGARSYEQITKDKKVLLDDISNLKHKNDDLEKTLKVKEVEEKDLQILISDLRNQVTALKEDNVTYKRKFGNDTTRMKQEYFENQKICGRYAEQILERNRCVDELKDKNYKTESELIAIKEQLDKSQVSLKHSEDDRLRLGDDLQRTKKENNTLTTENEHLNKKMTELSRELHSLEKRLDASEREERNLRQKNKDFEDVMRTEINSLEADLSSHRTTIRDREATMVRTQKELEEVSKTLKEVSIKFEKSEHEKLEGQKTLRQLVQRIGKLQPQLETSLQENSELQSKVANLEDEGKTLRETNRQLKNDNDEFERIHVDQRNKIYEHGNLIDHLNTKNNLLEEKAEVTEQCLKSEMQTHKSQIGTMESTLLNTRSERDGLKALLGKESKDKKELEEKFRESKRISFSSLEFLFNKA